ncbi:MAG: DUF2946 family protein [Oceanococcus sp.]
MDKRVVQAMAQWPDVPDVYGWLSLDARGRWRLRGETISNTNLLDFINRNYVRTAQGSYAFQNGPQRVHVELEATPWIAQTEISDGILRFMQHCEIELNDVEAVFLDQEGHLILLQENTPALLRDHDLASVLPYLLNDQGDAIEAEDLQHWMEGGKNRISMCMDARNWELKHAPTRDNWEAFFDYCATPKAK